jgi:hypothetical protein
MKNGLTAFQYSGYPLTLANASKETSRRGGLTVVRKPKHETYCHQPMIRVHQMVQSPINWDVDWFGNYE